MNVIVVGIPRSGTTMCDACGEPGNGAMAKVKLEHPKGTKEFEFCYNCFDYRNTPEAMVRETT